MMTDEYEGEFPPSDDPYWDEDWDNNWEGDETEKQYNLGDIHGI